MVWGWWVVLAVGCRVGGDGKSFLNENDELRQANLELERQVAESSQQIELLQGELRAYRESAAGAEPIEGAVPPVLSGLRFGRLTGAIDRDGDGENDAFRVYLEPVDQRGRMLVVAGRVNVQAVELRDDGPPRVLASRDYTPAELDAAYRSGLTGSHYTLVAPIDRAAVAELPGELTLRASLTQAGTGVTVAAQRVVTPGR